MNSRASEYVVVLDACVLMPILLVDLLLRLAEDPAVYSPRWSAEILAEVERNLRGPKFQLPPERAAYRLSQMKLAFPEAMVTGYGALVGRMENHPKDRHVLAAAVHAGADAILTSNSRDFPEAALAPHGIERLTPDSFLMREFELVPELVAEKVRAQAEGVGRPVETLVAQLSRVAPKFAGAVVAVF